MSCCSPPSPCTEPVTEAKKPKQGKKKPLKLSAEIWIRETFEGQQKN